MASSEWDLGQTLIEKGFCTLDQVREALSIQDRMKQMGVVPKTLPEVLLEKGYVSVAQLAEVGIRAAAPVPAARPARRGPPPAPAKNRAVPWFALVAVVCLVAAAVFLLPEVLKVMSTGHRERVEKKPEGEAGPTDGEKADAAAKEDLERIGEFARTANNFENAPEVVGRYEAFMKKHAGGKWELEGNRKLQEYRAKANDFARTGLEWVLKKESELVSQGRTAELLRLLRAFPKQFLDTTDSGRTVKTRLAELTARQREAYLRDKAEAEKLADQKKFEEALDRVVALKLSAPDDEPTLKAVGDLQTRIEFEYKAATAKVRQEVADVYFKVDGAMKEALARKPADPRKAAGAVAEFLTAPWKESQRPFVRMRGVDYDALRKAVEEWKPEAVAAICEAAVPDAETPAALSTAETALLDLRNAALVGLFYADLESAYGKAVAGREPLDLPGLGKGHFEKRGERTVYVADGKGVVDRPLSDADLGSIAMRAGPLDAQRHARLGFFYYYTAPSEHVRAYAHLVEAGKGSVKGLRPYLSDLTRSVQMELARTLRIKFAAAEDLYKSGGKAQARKELEELLEHKDHPFVDEKRASIEKMLFEIAEGSEKERRLALTYKGKGEALEGGRARVAYDFSDRSQLEAFEFVTEEGARKFKGRWKLERGALESSSEASAVRWKPALKGDVTVEYDLALLEEAQNVAVDLYYGKGQSRHYAAVLGFDWVGKADGDVQNTAEERFGMPRTCVIKYPVEADKSRWVLAGAWESWKSRLVGLPKGDWKPVKGKSYRMQIVRQGKSIRFLADRAVVWEGEDDAYAEGQIVFFSDSRVRLSNLALTFTP